MLYFSMGGLCYKSNGTLIEQNLVHRLWDMFMQWESDISSEHNNAVNLLEYYKSKIQGILQLTPQSHKDNVKCVLNCFINYAQFHEGGFLEQMEASEYNYEEIPGGNVKIPNGMSAIVNLLKSMLPYNCIKLNHAVQKIDWKQNKSTCLISCENGKVLKADHIIVTVPLGVLKSSKSTLFIPPLPKLHQHAIQSIGFGKVAKIFLFWDKPFWKLGSGSIKLAWSDEDLAGLPDMNQWYKKVFSFDEVLNNPSVLLAWLSGDEAEYMETLSDEEVLNTCTGVLRSFMGNTSIPPPNKILRSRWCTDQYTQGGYSYHCKGDHLVRPNLNDDLARPVFDDNLVPKILFAGEAVSKKYYSTMHAARDTGISQAQTLLSFMEKMSSKI